MTSRPRNSWILLVLGLAFALRVVGLPDLQLSGDAAWSVYLALKDLPALTLATAMDSHPPLFYYVLHAWMAASGLTELAVRFLSAVFGLLTVTLTYKLGQRLLGPWGGLIAGLLAAVSPFLVYFDRMPRMYSLLALLAALAIYLVLRLLDRGQVGGEQAPTPPPEGKNIRGTPPYPRPGGASDMGERGTPPYPRPSGASDVGELGIPSYPRLGGASDVGEGGAPPNPRPSGASDVGELGTSPYPRPSGASDVGELGTPPY
ncbi:MAG: glycosyltransferase family 39 protein, partial [Dehalococcoidia bacterium]|nr:glycosyltransferase family 39 protein [Dehalococcoidia bacterium]